MKKVNVFQGYRLILWVFLSVVLVTTLVLVFVQFQSRVAREQEQIKTQVQKSISSMNVLLEKANSNLFALRKEVEFHLNHPQVTTQHALVRYLQSDSSGRSFHMDALPAELQKKLGNITGLGKLDTTLQASQQSLNAALNAGPLLQAALENTSGATLTYAVFNREKFINLYPFIPSKDFTLSQEVLNHNAEVYTEVTPQNNPKREMKWSRIYQDEVGHGLMITAYLPFFKNNQLEGILGLDLTLDSLNAIVEHSQRKLGTLFVTTRDQQLLAHPKVVSSKQKAILSTKAAFPESIATTAIKNYLTHVPNTFEQEGNYWVYSENIPHTSWRITYLVNYWDIYLSVFRDVGINTTFIILTIFVLLFFTNRYSQRRFISPAMSLVTHIQNENNHLPGQPYQVPRQWQHWFDVITTIFADNRNLVQKLKVHNEALEQKVADRTREITAQNEELLQNQEEITSQRDYIASQNQALRRKEENIQHSLNAALTIQQAVLPAEQKFCDFFEDYFILFKPKDVVSGDFYWLWQKSPQEVLMMVGDCTGHGIPGAFMTMITSALLDRLTRIKGIENPAEVLVGLDKEVKKLLRQEETNSTDGLEGVVFGLKQQESGEYQLNFASARSQAYYILPHQSEVQVLDGDRTFVGGMGTDVRTFSNKIKHLPKGTLLYFGSDGYPDQNNAARKKLGRKQLKQLLLTVCSQKMSAQHQYLTQTLKTHMKDTDQRDDILLLGLKL
ncbi:MAG TPA: hypothetical protein DCS93_41830 [Microscillaceae bacterium]|nr:hypothetical protein [Microscillaceae bacterium]